MEHQNTHEHSFFGFGFGFGGECGKDIVSPVFSQHHSVSQKENRVKPALVLLNETSRRLPLIHDFLGENDFYLFCFAA